MSSSTIINKIHDLSSETGQKNYAYWYFQFSNQETQRVRNMLRSLVRQLCPTPIPEALRGLWDEHNRRGSEPDSKALQSVFQNIISSYQGDVFLVLDALDECPESANSRERTLLLEVITSLVASCKNVHVLATSRRELDIKAKLEQFLTLDLESNLKADLEMFVRTKVAEGQSSCFDDNLRVHVIDELLRIAERWFPNFITRRLCC
jgi:hypothetical protein